ncbi:mannose-6-phosphate isomerase [Kitasatospora cheerisanensis KCTC 2395]|uniref:Mannose-6-phosphate isomerase n=1 Tax=Kitasatospora cheerisanensis KCTC 2395 TaxID=1348663 RepID=A0A066YIP7_9ACTN|nr:mannose-6-phosphate isomerase [Kitasatospora cheerisanensis KCTC 2395]
MANSDNVLRCGLTPKHVDTTALAAVVDFRPHRPRSTSPPSPSVRESSNSSPRRRSSGSSRIELGAPLADRRRRPADPGLRSRQRPDRGRPHPHPRPVRLPARQRRPRPAGRRGHAVPREGPAAQLIEAPTHAPSQHPAHRSSGGDP